MDQTNLPQEEFPNTEPTPAPVLSEQPVPEQEPTPAEPAVPSEPAPAESAPQPVQAEQPAPAYQPTPVYQPAPTYQPITAPIMPPRPEKKKKTGRGLAVVAMILAILSLAANGFTIWSLYNHTDGNLLPQADIPQSSTPAYQYRDNVSRDDELTNQEIIRKLNPSVVTISTVLANQGLSSGSIGTGIIYTDNGYILTNAHVVEGATEISVTDYVGNEYEATLIGADSETDTAVLKIQGEDFPAAEFGQASQAVPGDRIIAIGTPYAVDLHNTATEGMVSAHRDNVTFSSLGGTVDLIQHDAAINPGNSGGPLVNAYGQIIGINTMKIFGDYDNLGFAISIDSILPIAEELMTNGKIVRPGIGITGYTYQTEELSGAYVESVVKGGAADKAGIRRGDIIIKANDTPISTIDELKTEIRKNKIGDSITLTYMRGDTVHTTVMVLEELKVD